METAGFATTTVNRMLSFLVVSRGKAATNCYCWMFTAECKSCKLLNACLTHEYINVC